MASDEGILRNADELSWAPVDPLGGGGDRRCWLFGDGTDTGLYAVRIRFPGGEPMGSPHWHPDFEFGTVLSGSLWVATGSRLARSDARRLSAGAFIIIPPRVRHAIWAEEEVVLQIHGPGPRITQYD